MEKKFPIITLSNGVRVGNFSSPHIFKFEDGSVLPACSKERALDLMLNATEVEEQNHPSDKNYSWVDIQLKYSLSERVEEALKEALQFEGEEEERQFDILIVPFPVLTSIREAFRLIDNFDNYGPDASQWYQDRWTVLRNCVDFCRTGRLSDRAEKILHIDRFCK